MANGNPFDQFDAPVAPRPTTGSDPGALLAPNVTTTDTPTPIDPTTGAVAPAVTTANPFDQFDPAPPAPAYSQWPGVIGRTFLESTAPLGYTDLSNELQREGQPVPTYQQYMQSIPQEPRYRGTLGYLQQGAATLGSPIGMPLSFLAPGATIAGDIAHEAARQAGYGPKTQAAVGAIAGGGGGALESTVVNLAGRAMDAATASRIASGADDVASDLRSSAGVGDPTKAGTNLKFETGKVIQDDVGNTPAVTGGSEEVKSTARAMKARAAKATGTDLPPMSPEANYLNNIDQAGDSEDAVDRALSSPAYWKSLPMKAKSALAAHVAGQTRENPEIWDSLTQTQKNELIPDIKQRMAVEATAQQSLSRIRIRTTPTPTASASVWQNALNRAVDIATHHVLGRAGLAGVGGGLAAHMLHIPPEYGEIAGAGLMALRPAARYAVTPRGATNILTGGTQGYLGGP